jgi:hypothetical protein
MSDTTNGKSRDKTVASPKKGRIVAVAFLRGVDVKAAGVAAVGELETLASAVELPGNTGARDTVMVMWVVSSDVGATTAAVAQPRQGIVRVIVVGVAAHTEQTVRAVLKPCGGPVVVVVGVLPVYVSVIVVVTG